MTHTETTMDDTTNEAAGVEPGTVVRLFEVELVRRIILAAVDQDAAWRRAEEVSDAYLDSNDLEPEEARSVTDATAATLAAVGTTSRVLGLVPEGENPRRLTVAKLIKAGLVESDGGE